MREDLKKMWDEAERTGQPVNVGNIVVCDSCEKDYTDSSESGGFIFGSRGYCPVCAPRMMQRINHYGEEQYIKAYCPEGMSFADFIRGYRGDRNYIQIKNL